MSKLFEGIAFAIERLLIISFMINPILEEPLYSVIETEVLAKLPAKVRAVPKWQRVVASL